MTETTASSPYATYWKAWAALLVITLVMVFAGETSVGIIIVGMVAKATIIAAWFMHLKHERLDFILYVAVSIVLASLVLFGLIAADGLAM